MCHCCLAQSLISICQTNVQRHLQSSAPIAVVVVINFKLAQANFFPPQGAWGLAALPISRGGSLSVPVMFVYNSRLNLSLELRCFKPHTVSYAKA